MAEQAAASSTAFLVHAAGGGGGGGGMHVPAAKAPPRAAVQQRDVDTGDTCAICCEGMDAAVGGAGAKPAGLVFCAYVSRAGVWLLCRGRALARQKGTFVDPAPLHATRTPVPAHRRHCTVRVCVCVCVECSHAAIPPLPMPPARALPAGTRAARASTTPAGPRYRALTHPATRHSAPPPTPQAAANTSGASRTARSVVRLIVHSCALMQLAAFQAAQFQPATCCYCRQAW